MAGRAAGTMAGYKSDESPHASSLPQAPYNRLIIAFLRWEVSTSDRTLDMNVRCTLDMNVRCDVETSHAARSEVGRCNTSHATPLMQHLSSNTSHP